MQAGTSRPAAVKNDRAVNTGRRLAKKAMGLSRFRVQYTPNKRRRRRFYRAKRLVRGAARSSVFLALRRVGYTLGGTDLSLIHHSMELQFLGVWRSGQNLTRRGNVTAALDGSRANSARANSARLGRLRPTVFVTHLLYRFRGI